jgi:Delta24-sterol reductase
MKHRLIPPVVLEFPGITVGGGFSGTSGESSSFKYGYYENTIISMEIVLAYGQVVRASRDERSDLFYGAASSFGTLGVTTLLEIQLIDAKPFVELTHHPVSNMSEAIAKIEETSQDYSTDYIHGIFYAKNFGIICTGKLTEAPREGLRCQTFTNAKDPWFYLHAKKRITQCSEGVTEIIPLLDYLFRYDRGGFCVGMNSFKYFITPFNRITRWVLDKYMHTRVMYHALHKAV